MRKYIIVAETGSDISPEMAAEYGIEIVPMHVSFDDETLDDGSFPVEKIPEFERQLQELMDTRYESVLTGIRTTGKLEKDTEEALKAALNELLAEFNPGV